MAAGDFTIEIQADRLTKSFGDKAVLREINLTVPAGDIVCIVGGSGSGKTVLLDHLTGLMPPTSGRVLAADHNAPPDARGAPPLVDLAALDSEALDLLRLHWAVVFQRNALFSGTVRENIALWLREHTRLSEPDIDARIKESLSAVALDVADVIDKDRDALSGGMAKRVAIARAIACAIACDPLVIFYDEPTTGLDPVVAGTIHELIWDTHNLPVGRGLPLADLDAVPNNPADKARRAALRRTTIIVTHDRDLLRRLAPRVVMLHESRIVFDGPYEEFGTSDSPPAAAYLAQMPALHTSEVGPARVQKK